MINNISCWYCSVVYPKDWPKCPECNHQNTNEDLKAALRELYPVIGDETDDDPYCQCGNDHTFGLRRKNARWRTRATLSSSIEIERAAAVNQEIGNDPYEEEAASGKYASCGKELP